MSGIIASLAGAPQQASAYGSYYQNAANEISNQYGSPAAQMFSKEQAAALRPQFANQQALLTSGLAAQGIAPSGAGRAAFGQLGADQAATLAGATAPLYQQALGQYGNIIGAMPGSQVQGYQGAINDFYQAVQMAGEAAAGMPPMNSGGSPNPTPGANAAGNFEYSGQPGSMTAPGSMPYYNPANYPMPGNYAPINVPDSEYWGGSYAPGGGS